MLLRSQLPDVRCPLDGECGLFTHRPGTRALLKCESKANSRLITAALAEQSQLAEIFWGSETLATCAGDPAVSKTLKLPSLSQTPGTLRVMKHVTWRIAEGNYKTATVIREVWPTTGRNNRIVKPRTVQRHGESCVVWDEWHEGVVAYGLAPGRVKLTWREKRRRGLRARLLAENPRPVRYVIKSSLALTAHNTPVLDGFNETTFIEDEAITRADVAYNSMGAANADAVKSCNTAAKQLPN